MADPKKPGYRTTEFWLGLAATLLTALYAGGAIPTTGKVATVAAIAATALVALGYTVTRANVKAANAGTGKPDALASSAATVVVKE